MPQLFLVTTNDLVYSSCAYSLLIVCCLYLDGISALLEKRNLVGSSCAYNLVLSWQIRNEKARRYLADMRKKQPIPFAHKFPNADPLALNLLERLLAFDPKDRPTAEEVNVELCFDYISVSYNLYFT